MDGSEEKRMMTVVFVWAQSAKSGSGRSQELHVTVAQLPHPRPKGPSRPSRTAEEHEKASKSPNTASFLKASLGKPLAVGVSCNHVVQLLTPVVLPVLPVPILHFYSTSNKRIENLKFSFALQASFG